MYNVSLIRIVTINPSLYNKYIPIKIYFKKNKNKEGNEDLLGQAAQSQAHLTTV
jgi:hypothetical protein